MTVTSHLNVSLNADIPARISINHWQLRDLLAVEADGRLLYVSENSVRAQAPEGLTNSDTVASFDFEPRCVATYGGTVAVGGQDRGEFAVKAKGQDQVHAVELGGSINNSICMGEDDDAIVSNNDRTIKHVNLTTLSLRESILLPTAINHTSLSPAKSHLVCVGDRAEAYFFSKASGAWSITKRLDASTDALFATAFHPTRPVFAVGSQDGSVLFWDQRYLSVPFQVVYSTRPHHPSGAIRAIKFSPAPLDLLVFTEASGYAHLMDVRGDQFSEELLRVGRREIAGCCWRGDGSRLYIGCSDGISEWRVPGRDRMVFPAIAWQ